MPHDEQKRGEGLAVVVIVALSLAVIAAVCIIAFAIGLRFYVSKRSVAQERAAVARKIEAMEAVKAARAAELSSKAVESKDDSAAATTPDG